jgi:hypothetical protein
MDIQAFLSSLGKRDRLRLYDSVRVCEGCASGYEALVARLQERGQDEEEMRQQTQEQGEEER